jgi:hypothetical protein
LNAAPGSFAWQILATPQTLAAALAKLEAEDAVALPLLSPQGCRALLAASESLTYRQAKPVIGEGERAVHQDFEICMPVPQGSLIHACAAAVEQLLPPALAELREPPLAAAPPLNDLVVQRYATGSRGISAHRDHVRYRDLVAIVTLAGQARFFVCRERSGIDAREVPIPPGSLLLMRAPGFAGRSDRPFHFLSDVTSTRVCVGIRHDVEADTPD